jgi:predicted dehydrogenase
MQGIDGYTVDDAMVVNARFKSGALGTFGTGCFPLGGHPEAPGGGIGLSLSSRKHLITFTGWHLDTSICSGNGQSETIPREENIFAIQNRAFLEAVKTGDRADIRSDYEDGMKTLAVTLAATESARHRGGAPVKVAL